MKNKSKTKVFKELFVFFFKEKMGYDTIRFHGPIDEELICSICHGVLENPVKTINCEHDFCKKCINRWLSMNSTCPVDRSNTIRNNLKVGSRLLRVLLSRLNISCDFAAEGCKEILQLDLLKDHLKNCPYDPTTLIRCVKDCELILPRKVCMVRLYA